ncbi:hypothetical protein [Streptomyces hundungensis]|uniref:hypothetical protein n=1 Tax=Streptomyces hundungensis TaxID=1077946 RepID=UPI0013C4B2E8|nr:hypothetical protein [Streptomyces hundungensis]
MPQRSAISWSEGAATNGTAIQRISPVVSAAITGTENRELIRRAARTSCANPSRIEESAAYSACRVFTATMTPSGSWQR